MNAPKNNTVPAIPLLLVDDHPVVRTGLSTMLQKFPQILVEGAVDSGAAAVDFLSHTSVAIVLLDLRMPGMTGIETIRRISQVAPATKVIILSSFDLDEEIHQAVILGASGYLLKDTSGEQIVEAIRRVNSGSTYFPKHIAERLRNRRLRADLSKREIEILGLVSKGFTNKEIAKALRLSQFTVRNHLNNITSKLEVTDRTEAAFVAIKSGIISVLH
jgi:two-component system NarL family response regulator